MRVSSNEWLVCVMLLILSSISDAIIPITPSEFTAQLYAVTGPLPSEIGLMRGLHDLRLLENMLTGSIPSELCSLQSLREGTARAAVPVFGKY